jgi:hypothetical protein
MGIIPNDVNGDARRVQPQYRTADGRDRPLPPSSGLDEQAVAEQVALHVLGAAPAAAWPQPRVSSEVAAAQYLG